MIFGDGDGSGKNNGTYFEISFRACLKIQPDLTIGIGLHI